MHRASRQCLISRKKIRQELCQDDKGSQRRIGSSFSFHDFRTVFHPSKNPVPKNTNGYENRISSRFRFHDTTLSCALRTSGALSAPDQPHDILSFIPLWTRLFCTLSRSGPREKQAGTRYASRKWGGELLLPYR